MKGSGRVMREDIAAQYERILKPLNKLAAKLQSEVVASLASIPHIDRIAFRCKNVESFVKKALKENEDGTPRYSEPFEQLEDIVAGRVIVFFLSDIDIVTGKLDVLFHPVEGFRKSPDRDAEFGYESCHRVYHIPSAFVSAKVRDELPKTFEVQIRTLMMHAYAEPQHDIAYKSPSELSPEIRRELAWIAASAWGADHAYNRVYTSLSRS